MESFELNLCQLYQDGFSKLDHGGIIVDFSGEDAADFELHVNNVVYENC